LGLLPGLIFDGIREVLTRTLPNFGEIIWSQVKIGSKWLKVKFYEFINKATLGRYSGELDTARQEYDSVKKDDLNLRKKISDEDSADEKKRDAEQKKKDEAENKAQKSEEKQAATENATLENGIQPQQAAEKKIVNSFQNR
jgi:hypothetical protein